MGVRLFGRDEEGDLRIIDGGDYLEAWCEDLKDQNQVQKYMFESTGVSMELPILLITDGGEK